MSTLLEKIKYHYIEVLYPGCLKTSKAEQVCVVGQDLIIDYKCLEHFCFQPLPPEGLDLIVVTAAIVFADRNIKRMVAEDLKRNIHLTIPVQSNIWFKQDVIIKLTQVLHFITGDCWQFCFLQAKKDILPDVGQMFIPLLNKDNKYVILPYSDGLDSFAAGRLITIDEPDATPILVTAQNAGVSITHNDLHKMHQVRIPVRIKGEKNEVSYRTRTFMFKALSALAAFLSKSSRIIIPENGQGSIGSSLIRYFNEWPHRSSDPLFTIKLADFLKSVLGQEFIFEHPYKWNTKGQVLTLLKQHYLHEGWQYTFSCVYGARHSTLGGKRVNCGVCSGCLLRRVSLFTANYDTSQENYRFSDFDIHNSNSKHKKAFRDVANTGAYAMQELADFSINSSEFTNAVHHMSMYFSEDLPTIKDYLKSLINNHANEWKEFVQYHGNGTYLNIIGKSS